jgi:hypothetical protein
MNAKPRLPAAHMSLDLRPDSRATDFWDAWLFAAIDCRVALDAWLAAPSDDKAIGYSAYVACLDREEQAALVLAERLDPRAAARIRGNA